MSEAVAVHRHHWAARWTHWVNVPLLAIMIWSGLRIYWADIRDPFGVGIGPWHWFTIDLNADDPIPNFLDEQLELRRRLARGMAFHFTFGWFFTLNGLAFAVHRLWTGTWRKLVPTVEELRRIPAVLAHEVHLRAEAPPADHYNAVQKVSYLGVLLLAVAVVLSGLAIFSPTQLQWLTAAFGGYETARAVHFTATMGFLLFFVVHVIQVARSGWANASSMVTGYELRKDRT